MKNTLIAILVFGILIIGYLFIKEKTRPTDYTNVWPETVPAMQTNNNGSKPKLTNSAVREEWQSHSSEYLLGVATNAGLYLEPGSGVSLSQMVDLTGNGIDEAIFTGNGGNNGASFIMIKGDDGKSYVAKQKYKDGTIGPVQLTAIGRVMVSEGYKLLPNENGFYTVSKSNVSTDGETSNFKCNVNGVNAYKWNASTKMFEWNQSMTTKYTAEVCG